MLEENRLRRRPEFSTLRDFIHSVTKKTCKIHINNDTSSTTHVNEKSIPISSNLSTPLEARCFNQNDVNYHHIVKIIVSSTKYPKFAINESKQTRNVATLEIAY